MTTRVFANFCSFALLFGLCTTQCFAQSILDQKGDQLLNGFDVDQKALNNQYQPKPTKAQQLFKLLESAIPQVDVDTSNGGTGIKVRAPFVNVNVQNGQSNVKVNAPFVNVDTGSGVKVNAPFVKVNHPLSGGPGCAPNGVTRNGEAPNGPFTNGTPTPTAAPPAVPSQLAQ